MTEAVGDANGRLGLGEETLEQLGQHRLIIGVGELRAPMPEDLRLGPAQGGGASGAEEAEGAMGVDHQHDVGGLLDERPELRLALPEGLLTLDGAERLLGALPVRHVEHEADQAGQPLAAVRQCAAASQQPALGGAPVDPPLHLEVVAVSSRRLDERLHLRAIL